MIEQAIGATITVVRFIIAIDGGAGTGTSTLAERLAIAIGWKYFNTGNVYRALTWLGIKRGLSLRDTEAWIALSRELEVTIEGATITEINGHRVTDADLRTQQVEQIMPHITSVEELRQPVREFQHRFAAENNCVMEGRDIGTVVFPNADLKFFLTCEAEERARRRSAHANRDISVQELLERDRLDEEREASPMRPADDAIILDTTFISVPQLVTTAWVLMMAQERLRQALPHHLA